MKQRSFGRSRESKRSRDARERGQQSATPVTRSAHPSQLSILTDQSSDTTTDKDKVSRNVLILENSQTIAEILMQFVDELGHQAVWVTDQDSAAIALKNFNFDVGVVELYLQDGSPGTDILPLSFPTCIYTGVPGDAFKFGLPVFSKTYPYALMRWVEAVLLAKDRYYEHDEKPKSEGKEVQADSRHQTADWEENPIVRRRSQW